MLITSPPSFYDIIYIYIYVQVQWFCHFMRSLMMCELYTGLSSAINLQIWHQVKTKFELFYHDLIRND